MEIITFTDTVSFISIRMTVTVLIVVGLGFWWVGADPTKNSGAIHTQSSGHETLPTTGWLYYNGNTFVADKGLKFQRF